MKRRKRVLYLLIVATMIIIYMLYSFYERNIDSTAAITSYEPLEYTLNPFENNGTHIYNIYISNKEVQGADGSLKKPYSSIEEAKEEIRKLDTEDYSLICVNLMAGEYFLDEELVFTEKDSGSESCPVLYQAYGTDEVSIVGATRISKEDIEKIDECDEKFLNARKQGVAIYSMDLSKYSNNTADFIQNYGTGIGGEEYIPIRLYIDKTPMQLSRWPNDDSITIEDVKIVDSSIKIKYASNGEHTQNWDLTQSIMICGFWQETWAYNGQIINSVDVINSTFNVDRVSRYQPQPELSFYFCNLKEEIDMQGEFAYDNGILYFGITEENSLDNIYISYNTEGCLKFEGANNIIVNNIDFRYFRETPVSIENCKDIDIQNCNINGSSYKGIKIESSNRVHINNCEISNCGYGGIDINCGNRKELNSSEIRISDCAIHDVDQILWSYSPALLIAGMGIYVDDCEIYNLKHCAIQLDGANDVILFHNIIHDVVTMSADMGAVYYGRDPTELGICIIGNELYNIGNTIYSQENQYAIYIDDGSYGALIYGNTFVNSFTPNNKTRYAIAQNGSRYSYIANNKFYNYNAAVRGNSWGYKWWLWALDLDENRKHTVRDKLISMQINSTMWENHYKDFFLDVPYYGLSIHTNMWGKLSKQFPQILLQCDLNLLPDILQEIVSRLMVKTSSSNIFVDNELINTQLDFSGVGLGKSWGNELSVTNTP